MAKVRQSQQQVSRLYVYSGGVTDGFGNFIGSLHNAETWAVSPAQAKSRLEWRYKIDHGYDPKRFACRLSGMPTLK